MDKELAQMVVDATDAYFTTVSRTGHISDKDTAALTALVFIYDTLKDYPGYIKDADLVTILKLLNCLAGTSCLIPTVPIKQITKALPVWIHRTQTRINEENAIRFAEMEAILLKDW